MVASHLVLVWTRHCLGNVLGEILLSELIMGRIFVTDQRDHTILDKSRRLQCFFCVNFGFNFQTLLCFSILVILEYM